MENYMRPTLIFDQVYLKTAPKGPEASVPNLLGMDNMQNKTEFLLDEYDEIYEGYGTLNSVYPYRDYTCYTRECGLHPVKTAVLENEYLRAVFLPEFGGRLWQLTDLKSGRELLYTNDVIRPGNLALRDAWFSGGVEWNIGLIGHTPLTMEPLFTARLETGSGLPVLRMYEYERIRRMVYQMDFWLDEGGAYLNCRMRVVNHNPEVTPMYWWSNMAVPEYEDGRVIVPADSAYSSGGGSVYKVPVPVVDGIDISHYRNIPGQVDYFFHIPEESPRYIANVASDGFGLLQYSTRRLRGRKLFSWGNNSASARWQEYLTEEAGRYIEIQAGLGKTQYGCIPMAPHTAWEWIERYGAVQLNGRSDSFEEDRETLTAMVRAEAGDTLEKVLENSREWAVKPGKVIYRGSGYADLENACRMRRGEKPLSPHLDFSSEDQRQAPWRVFLETGRFPSADPAEIPADCMADDFWYEMLKKQAEQDQQENLQPQAEPQSRGDRKPGKASQDWHLLYHLALNYMARGRNREAESCFIESIRQKENAWSRYGLASLLCLEGREYERAVSVMEQGLMERAGDLSYIKEGFRVLARCGGYDALIRVYEQLPEEVAAESRVVLEYIMALNRTGSFRKAYELLTADGGLVAADLREGENSIADLWLDLRRALNMPEEEVPHVFDFSAEIRQNRKN